MAPITEKADILWLESCESTNKEVRKAFDTLDNLSIIAAGSQTSGRGQGEHRWLSEDGANLTFSVLMEFPDLKASEAILINCISALSVTDYLLTKGIEPHIKWPNDIWVADRKICGLLIENILEDGLICRSIVGVGLNVNQTSWPCDLPNPVSMKELTGTSYFVREELNHLSECFRKRQVMLADERGRLSLKDEFLSLGAVRQ